MELGARGRRRRDLPPIAARLCVALDAAIEVLRAQLDALVRGEIAERLRIEWARRFAGKPAC